LNCFLEVLVWRRIVAAILDGAAPAGITAVALARDDAGQAPQTTMTKRDTKVGNA
jgi:hypothetical protein